MKLQADAILFLACDPRIAPQPEVMMLPDPFDTSQAGALASWLDRHVTVPSRRLMVVLPNQLQLPPWIDAAVHQQLNRAAISDLTIRKNGGTWARNMVRSFNRNPRWVTTAQEPLRGLPAFVVGAGSSLDRNGHLLAEAQKRGPIITVNSGAAVCAHHGVTPDVIMCCEAVDLPTHLAPFRGKSMIALDALASGNNWDAAGPDAVGFMLHEPYMVRYAGLSGFVPLHYSTSSTTAAASLALWWGASPIIMVGQDNGSTGGKPYADGSPFADMRSEVRDGVLHYFGSSKDPYGTHAVMRPSWGDGPPTPSDHTFDYVLLWYARMGLRYTLINATEGGCRINSAYEMTLADVLRRFETQPERRVSFAATDTAPALEEIGRHCEHIIRDGLELPPIDFDLIHMYTVPASLNLYGKDRRVSVAEACQRGAREMLEIVNA